MAGAFEIKGSVVDALGFAGQLFDNQIPYATAKALTRTAQIAQQDIRNTMESVFDRPTPYTLNSTFVKPATKTDLVARVWIKDDSGKGTAAGRYLSPEVFGGERQLKRFESALRNIGLLPVGMFAAPGSAAKLDQYGNVARSQVIEVMAYLQAFGEQGYRANMTAAKRSKLQYKKQGYEYFVLRQREGNMPPGIYRRDTGRAGARPIFIFVRTPSYKQRLDFNGIAQRAGEREFTEQFRIAFAEAVATAR